MEVGRAESSHLDSQVGGRENTRKAQVFTNLNIALLGSPPRPRRLLPSRPRPHKPEHVSDLSASGTVSLPVSSLSPSPFPGPLHQSQSLTLKLLCPAPNPRGLLSLKYRPHQPQPVGDPPVLWPAPSHLSTSTAAEPCSTLQRNPAALVQLLPVDKQMSDSPARWTVVTPGLCSPKTHSTAQPLPNHHLLCGQLIGLDTVHIIWRTDAICPHTVQTRQRITQASLLEARMVPEVHQKIQALLEVRPDSETQEDFGFTKDQNESRDPRPSKLQQKHPIGPEG